MQVFRLEHIPDRQHSGCPNRGSDVWVVLWLTAKIEIGRKEAIDGVAQQGCGDFRIVHKVERLGGEMAKIIFGLTQQPLRELAQPVPAEPQGLLLGKQGLEQPNERNPAGLRNV